MTRPRKLTPGDPLAAELVRVLSDSYGVPEGLAAELVAYITREIWLSDLRCQGLLSELFWSSEQVET